MGVGEIVSEDSRAARGFLNHVDRRYFRRYDNDMENEPEQLRIILKEELRTFNGDVLLPTFGRYTEEVVLPAIEASEQRLGERIEASEQRLNVRIGKLQSDFIDFVTRQINDAKGEIIRAIREQQARDRTFKQIVIGILERNKLADTEELEALRGLLNQVV